MMTNALPNLCSILIATTLLSSCAREEDGAINYLNQDPPGLQAELFSAGLISTDSIEHSAPAFSPDGSVVLWTVLDRTYRASMMEMTFANGKWSAPHRVSFADSVADDYYPSFSPDGKKLYFSSRRKVPDGYGRDNGIRIWVVERDEHGWQPPVPMDTMASNGEDYAHSVTSNGTIYFSSSQGGPTNWNIMKSVKTGGAYTTPVMMPYNINSVDYEDGPYVASDESFLIFESQRPEGIQGSIDLYISFNQGKGSWTIPVNMGPKVNSAGSERFARLSPDGKYLFFGSTRNATGTKRGFDIFWIDAKVIDELKREATAQTSIDLPLGDDILASLYENEVDSAAQRVQRWLTIHPTSLDATVILSSLLRKQGNFNKANELLAQTQIQWANITAIIMETALVKFGLNKEGEARQLLEPVLVEGDQLRERYLYLSRALLDMRMFEVSDDYFEKAMALHASPYPYLRRGCAYARIGNKEKAFAALDKAVELGISTRAEYEENPDLQTLKLDPRWKKLVEKL